ncbi:MAG: hypothetical protein M1835_000359 [Candelina submexicana]|nr:MAG: hypothetical protein M1835_000359 [Candelina submexicana]
MAENFTPIRVAQTVGITANAFLAGNLMTMSFYAVPTLLLAPTPLLLRQWRKMWNLGKRSNPPIAAIGLLSNAYLAYKQYNAPLSTNHPRGEMYAIAAFLSAWLVLYTPAFMSTTNGQLLEAAEDMEGFDVGEEVEAQGKKESARQLIDKWGVLNLGRSAGPLVGALVGLWASLA